MSLYRKPYLVRQLAEPRQLAPGDDDELQEDVDRVAQEADQKLALMEQAARQAQQKKQPQGASAMVMQEICAELQERGEDELAASLEEITAKGGGPARVQHTASVISAIQQKAKKHGVGKPFKHAGVTYRWSRSNKHEDRFNPDRIQRFNPGNKTWRSVTVGERCEYLTPITHHK
jgi:hypothetical protein